MLRSKMLRMLATSVAVLLLATGSALASSFSFPYAGNMGGAEVEAGRYNVTWEQSSPDVSVTLTKGKNVVATVKGRMETRDRKYDRNMVLYITLPDGSQRISELRIGGTSSAIVFDE